MRGRHALFRLRGRFVSWPTLAISTGALALALVAPAAAQAPPKSGDPLPSSTAPVTPQVAPGFDLTVSSIQARMQGLEGSEVEDADLRAAARKDYGAAIADLQAAAGWKERASALSRLQKERERILASIRSEAEAWSRTAPTVVADASSLSEVETWLVETEASLTVVRQSLAQVDAEIQGLAERRLVLPVELASAGAKREGLLGELTLPPLPVGSVESALASRAASLAKDAAGEAQATALELELSTYEVRRELLSARRDLLKRKSEVLTARSTELQSALATRRASEAEKAAEEARADRAALARVHPVLGSLAEQNAELTEARAGASGLAARVEQASRDLSAVQKLLAQVEEKSKGLRQKVAAAGLTDSIGLLLRKEKDDIPDIDRARGSILARRETIASAQLEALTLQDSLEKLPELESEVEEILAAQRETLAAQDRRRVESSARNVLDSRRTSLESLIRDYNTLFTTLVDLDARESELVRVVGEYSAFIDRHVLWIPSTRTFVPGAVESWRDAAAWLVDPRNVSTLARRLQASARAQPLAMGSCLLFVFVAFLYRPRMRRLHTSLCEQRSSVVTAIPVPVAVLLLATALAALVPLVMRFLAWALASAPLPPDEFSRALVQALRRTSLAVFVLEFLRRASGPRGSAWAFLGWPAPALVLVRKQIVVAEVVAMPAFFVATLLGVQSETAWSDTLGRFAFCVGTGSFGFVLHRLLSPRGQLLEQVLRRTDLEWVRPVTAKLAWVPGAIAVAVIGIALAGYYYTALILMRRLWFTAMVVVAFLIANAVTLRWLASKHVEDEDEGEDAGPGEAAALPNGALDPARVSAQTRTLLRMLFAMALAVSLFVVWEDVFPALRFFESIELWRVQGVEQRTVGAGDTLRLESVPVQVPITVANLLLAVAGLVLAVVGARNLPGLLEMTVLSNARLDRGLRYAIASISRYAVTLLGGVMALRNLGVDWSSVQWLAAAVSVGLGFGLQEIFANFVSGLILLFERPVRVGDTVTLGGTTGTVSRIHMRATTILDWDRKELIVPNKEFITGQLVNWSLTDPTLRLVLPVGVAYGSDLATVERILYDVAKQDPHVLEHPSPLVVFTRFGDSSLDFELRVFVATPDVAAVARHGLLLEIDRKFRAARIEIPYPQRDIHLRSVEDSAAETLATAAAASKEQGPS